MVVVVLLALIWAAVLVPPAVQAHAARRDAFLVSFGPATGDGAPPPAVGRSSQVHRRRRIAGGLLLAMAGTLLAGLLPTFRILLVVHLFLVDSFIAYVALLAYMANRRAMAVAAEAAMVGEYEPEPEPDLAAQSAPPERPKVRRRLLPSPGPLVDLPPVFPAG